MFRWRPLIHNSKDLVLLNREDLDLRELSALFDEIEKNWADNFEEISRPMMNGLREFYESSKASEGKIVLRYKVYSRMLRWIITSGNLKYDSKRFYQWRDALRALWTFLFRGCLHEFRIYLGEGRYSDDDETWKEWFNCIGGETR